MIQVTIAKLISGILSKVIVAIVVMAALQHFTDINALTWGLDALETLLWDMFGEQIKNYIMDKITFW